MGHFDYNFSSFLSSPVIALPLQQSPHQLSMNPSSSKAFALPSPLDPVAPGFPPSTSQPNTPSVPSRKRSRDESNLEDANYFPSSWPTSVPDVESEKASRHDDSMSVVRPNGFNIDNGTWVEEKQSQIPITPPADRPPLRGYKSQRLDLTATPAIEEEINLGNGVIVAAPSPPKTSAEPTVDDFTIHLGIGWSRISSEEHMQAAARGWAKYIENHYDVTEPEIKLQSRGLASYLVAAKEGWYLFGEDLKQGRLVSRSLEGCFENLRTSPPVFDGVEVVNARAGTPKVTEMPKSVMETNIMMADGRALHGVMVDNHRAVAGGPNGHSTEVEMDMS